MTTERLNLLFPQWQGSGTDNPLFYAANVLARSCPDIDFTPVPVPETQHLTTHHGILGYDSILSQMEKAADIVTEAQPGFILTIGGDCGIEPIPVSFLNRYYKGEFTLVWLDAHADLNTPATSPSGHFHGMPLATLLGEGDPAICSTCCSTLSPEQIILAGVRALDPAESDFIQSQKLTRLGVQEMEKDHGALAKAIQEKGNDPVYIHIDMDVLDPKAYPYIKHPEPRGLMPHTLGAIIDEIKASCTITGLGLMEFTLDAVESENTTPPESLAMVRTLMDKLPV